MPRYEPTFVMFRKFLGLYGPNLFARLARNWPITDFLHCNDSLNRGGVNILGSWHRLALYYSPLKRWSRRSNSILRYYLHGFVAKLGVLDPFRAQFGPKMFFFIFFTFFLNFCFVLLSYSYKVMTFKGNLIISVQPP